MKYLLVAVPCLALAALGFHFRSKSPDGKAPRASSSRILPESGPFAVRDLRREFAIESDPGRRDELMSEIAASKADWAFDFACDVLVSDPDPAVREGAAIALTELDPARAPEVLERALESETHEQVRSSIEILLAR